ncbi:unnamed protein product [Lactuca virosa]|uniref:Uncharacterized protein n=1 Tax=Lactuca virosa TaxID=75947 RepID=A0AAU9MHH9_9ASTR|nr:unnamed protein product [Lactuca virosa]
MVLRNVLAAMFLTAVITFPSSESSSVAEDAYPSSFTASMTSCDLDEGGRLSPIRREVYDEGRIIDISHRYHPDMPSWGSDDGLGEFLRLPASIEERLTRQQFRDENPRLTQGHTWMLQGTCTITILMRVSMLTRSTFMFLMWGQI